MSFSANHKVKNYSWNYLDKKYIDDRINIYTNNKRESSKKDESRLNIAKLNANKGIPSSFSNSSVTTNISIVRDKENKDNIIEKCFNRVKDFSINSYRCPIKPILEDSFENIFISKQKIIYKSPKISTNNKIISFQKQRNRQIMEFSLFDDKLIFKDINKSYLQDEHDDDGSESSEEKINDGKLFLTQELEDTAKELSASLKKNPNEKVLSRKIRFKN
jgi:hypothetical protein